VFCGKGGVVKKILSHQWVAIDFDDLARRIAAIGDEDVFCGHKSKVQQFCSSESAVSIESNTPNLLLQHGQVYLKDNISSAFEKLLASTITEPGVNGRKPNKKSADDAKLSLQTLLRELVLDRCTYVVSKERLTSWIMEETALNEAQVDSLLHHLDHFEQIRVDHRSLKSEFTDVKNESIFLGKMAAVKQSLLVRKLITLQQGGSQKVVQLEDNATYVKKDVVNALKQIVSISDDSSPSSQSSFTSLLIHLQFDTRYKAAALTSFQQYSLKDKVDSLAKVKDYLSVFNLKDVSVADTKLMEQLDLSVDKRLEKQADCIVSTLLECVGQDDALTKESFGLKDDDAFAVLRALLSDAGIIMTSLYGVLATAPTLTEHSEREMILMSLYSNGGITTDKDFVLKTAKHGSVELFHRLKDLKLLKGAKVHFPYGRARYVPEFAGGNSRKDSSDPAVRMDSIKSKVRDVVKEVFRHDEDDDNEPNSSLALVSVVPDDDQDDEGFDKSSPGNFSNGEDKIDDQSNGVKNGDDIKGGTANEEIMNSQSFDEGNFTIGMFQPIGESLSKIKRLLKSFSVIQNCRFVRASGSGLFLSPGQI
jgi:hypothetical protein